MSLVVTALQKAQRIEISMPWGPVVWHVWRPLDTYFTNAPLVLLHGGSGSWTHWIKNVTHLSVNREVWALDMPGFGDSELPDGVKDADTLAPCLAQILAVTFPQTTVDLIGFSFGGMTAGLMTANHPELIKSLILVGVPGLGLMVKNLPMHGLLESMTDSEKRAVHRHNLKAMMLNRPTDLSEEIVDLQMSNVDRDRMRRRRLARTDVLTKVESQWQCPVHGIWGEQDALYVDTLNRIGVVLPSLKSLQIIPDAGHWVQFENSEAFHLAIEKLL